MKINNCSNCIFFNEDYNKLRRENDDKIKLNNDTANNNYCHFYENGINKDIWNGLTKCENKVIKGAS